MNEFESNVDDYQEDVVGSHAEEGQAEDIYADEYGDIPEPDEGVEETPAQEGSEVTEPKQSKEENAKYANIRRKAEEEAKAKLSKERQELEEARKEIQKMKRQQEEQRIEADVMSGITYDKVIETADRMGTSEEYARELLISQARNEATKKKAEYYERFQEIQEQKAKLKDKPFFNELESDLDKMLQDNPELLPETAYKFLRGDKFEELMERRSTSKEKSMIANMQDKARRKGVSSDGTPDPSAGLSEFGKEFATFLGVDPREVAKVVKARKNTKR